MRFIGFYDGYTRVFSERPGDYDKKADVRAPSKMAIIDAISGKVEKEGADRRLRRAGPRPASCGRSTSAGRCSSSSMKTGPVSMWLMRWARSSPRRWPSRSTSTIRNRCASRKGRPPGQLTFGLAVDPVNKDAVQRQKVDLPMLDVYSADAASGTAKLRGRVFMPRPVTWRSRADVLVVLKRWKSFSRGGDELQIYDFK